MGEDPQQPFLRSLRTPGSQFSTLVEQGQAALDVPRTGGVSGRGDTAVGPWPWVWSGARGRALCRSAMAAGALECAGAASAGSEWAGGAGIRFKT